MRILSIDPATILGWAISLDNSGTINYKLRSNESKGLKFLKFSRDLKSLIEENDIELVVYEKPGGRHYNGIRSHANFEGCILSICEAIGTEYKDYSATEIKKHAKNLWEEKNDFKHKGHMKKEHMEEAAKDLYPDTKIIDDNHADALFLLSLAKTQYDG